MDELDGVEVGVFPDAAAWETWLVANVERQEGVWLKLAKKGSGIPSVTSDEVVDIGLCYGWVSGQRRSFDDSYYLQKYVPRRPNSLWSQVNVEKVARLTAAGRMREPGLAEVRAAQADGRWDAAYDAPSTATVPDDLQRELDDNQRARDFFATLDSRNRYAILHRIADAKRPETRARRIAKYVAMLSDQEKIY